MILKYKLALFAMFSILCFCFFTQMPTQAYSSTSFNTSTGEEYTWEVNRINVVYYVNPYLTQVGDRLKLVITIANTTEIGGITYDSVYAMLYHNTAANRTWTLAGSSTPFLLAIFNGTYFDCFDFPYLHPQDLPIAWDWMSGNWLSYGSKAATTLYGIRVYSSYTSPAFGNGNPYEEYDYKDGVLFSWGYALGNGTAWDIHTLIIKKTGDGISGFLILPTFLIFCGFLAIYTLFQKKKLDISV
ncbi:MAG TPA: hypothetical protein VMV49_07435 [Candidatus Deferrimicrobium sp.]|nr:hypothetical protein [Candidatus Deferrimicrobium sp.]